MKHLNHISRCVLRCLRCLFYLHLYLFVYITYGDTFLRPLASGADGSRFLEHAAWALTSDSPGGSDDASSKCFLCMPLVLPCCV